MSKLEKIFNAWVSSQKILIADPSGASRSGLARSLVDLGAKTQNITMIGQFEQALAEIDKLKPTLVVTDYDLPGGCGLDLIQGQKNNAVDDKTCFVMVTGNTSQSAVAQAAEEDVDAFVLKPYTIEVLRATITKAVIAKINPSQYMIKIKEGKEVMDGGDFDAALKIFEEASELNEKPSLALFYHGQTNLMKEVLEVAKGDYKKGLDYSKIHFKCMTGLFDVLMKEKEFTDAYDVVKKISRYFPANPERLSSVLRLAIMTESYEDVERYYQLFTNLDQRNDSLIKYVCASLVVCGKFYLQTGHGSRAMELFNKAGVTAAGRPRILKEIIMALVGAGYPKDALPYLQRFPAATRKENDFKSMELLVNSHLQAPGMTLESGRKLLQEGVEDPSIYIVMIQTLCKINKKDKAQEYVGDATKKFPDKQKEFENAWATTKPDS